MQQSGPLCRTKEVSLEMKKAILTTKVGMTQIFGENGVLIPVTVLLASIHVLISIKEGHLLTINKEEIASAITRGNKP